MFIYYNTTIKKNNLIPFMSLSLTAQINKSNLHFGMLECKILSFKFFYGENIALMTLRYRMQILLST
jgi:hypothetical protein